MPLVFGDHSTRVLTALTDRTTRPAFGLITLAVSLRSSYPDVSPLDQNVDHARLPGHPKWHLAPIESGWIGQSLSSICTQLKDPERNGGIDLEELHHHMAEDSLVGWAWSPGAGREPAPGNQVTFGKLIRAWIDTGAHCPDGEAGANTGPEPATSDTCANCH